MSSRGPSDESVETTLGSGQRELLCLSEHTIESQACRQQNSIPIPSIGTKPGTFSILDSTFIYFLCLLESSLRWLASGESFFIASYQTCLKLLAGTLYIITLGKRKLWPLRKGDYRLNTACQHLPFILTRKNGRKECWRHGRYWCVWTEPRQWLRRLEGEVHESQAG